jgi:hypothetical protein
MVSATGRTGVSGMANARPMPAWKYPLRAGCDLAIIVLGLLLATWPLIVLFLLYKIIF